MGNEGRMWWVGALKWARTSAAGRTNDEVGARKQGAPLAYVACPKISHFGAVRSIASVTSISNSNITTTELQPFKIRNPLFQQVLFLCILDCFAALEVGFEEARPALSSLWR